MKNYLLKALLCAAVFTMTNTSLLGQIQIGLDIDGSHLYERSGWSVSMPNETTIAVGSKYFNGVNFDSGRVRVFTWDGTNWIQKGADILGDTLASFLGASVSMPDENTLATGAPGPVTGFGYVRVYKWDGTNWIPKGQKVTGIEVNDHFGDVVSMGDSNTFAVGAPFYEGPNLNDPGALYVYKWDGNAWVMKGNPIEGAPGSFLGNSISMPDSNTVAYGAANYGNVNGMAAVICWRDTAWQHKFGIWATNSGDDYGRSVHMPDSTLLVVSAPGEDGINLNSGRVYLYSVDSAYYNPIGSIYGSSPNQRFGSSVFLRDANTVAVGTRADGTALSGAIRIFKRDQFNNFYQAGNAIEGEYPNDRCGEAISMPSLNVIGIGVYHNSEVGVDAGHARVFGGLNVGLQETEHNHLFSVFPNPSEGEIRIQLNNPANTAEIIIRNILGQKIIRSVYSPEISITLPEANGVYTIEILADGVRAVEKIVKM